MEKALGPRFIADVMVGRLARWLRILGFDVLYSNEYSDDDVVRIADAEDRIVLTRDAGLVDRLQPAAVILIENDDYAKQVGQVLKTVGTQDFRLFSRCLDCNTMLIQTDKEKVFERVPPYIYLTQDHFSFCPSCSRIYWRGTHVEDVRNKIKRWVIE